MNTKDKTEFKVGLYLIAFMVIVVSSVVYIGIKKDLFAKKVNFFVTSNTGEKIERGIPVKLSGFKIGQVTELYLDNIDYVKIEIEVLEKYYKWFKQDSKVILEQEGIIGNTYLKLIPGSERSPVLEPGSVLRLNKIGGLNEILDKAQPVMDDLKNIVSNIKRLSEQFAEKDGSLQKTIRNLEEITSKMNSKDGLIYYLSQDKRPVERIYAILARTETILRETEGIFTDIDSLVKNADSRVESLSSVRDEAAAVLYEGKEFIRELRSMGRELTPAVSDINAILREFREASENLKTLRMESEHTLHVGTQFIEKLNESWLMGEAEEKKPAPSMPLP
jgi:phospholipid/cholesterol/gamma-HCH transport system substrate-binding protein